MDDFIVTQIKLIDNMTPVLDKINAEMVGMNKSLGQIQSSTNLMTSTMIRGGNTMGGHIRQAANEQRLLNNQINQGVGLVGNLKSAFFRMFGVISAGLAVKKFIGLSDELTSVNARIGMINDGTQTDEQLKDEIYQMGIRSKTGYLGAIDIVSKLGQRAPETFTNNKELLQFAENLNKHFKVAGATQQEIYSASLQLTQALGSGVLRGDELNAVFEASPNIIRTIADYLNVPVGKIREMAKEGQITADIVKNAMLASTDAINEKFDQTGMTFGNLMQRLQDGFIRQLEPAANMLSNYLNNEEFINNLDTLIQYSGLAASGITALVGVAIDGFNLIGEVINTIPVPLSALLGGIITFVGVTQLATLGIAAFDLAVKILNSTMLTSPLFWLGAILGVAVYYFFLLADSVGGVQNAFTVLGLKAANVFEGIRVGIATMQIYFSQAGMRIQQGMVAVATGIAVAFLSTIAAIMQALQDLANAIANIFNVQVTVGDGAIKSIHDVINGLDQQYRNFEEDINFRVGIGDKYIDRRRNTLEQHKQEREQKITEMVNRANSDKQKAELLSGMDALGSKIAAPMGANTDAVKDNTAKLKDGLKVKVDDLTWLKEILTMRNITQFSWDKLDVSVQNQFGDVHESADLNAWLAGLNDDIEMTISSTMSNFTAVENV